MSPFLRRPLAAIAVAALGLGSACSGSDSARHPGERPGELRGAVLIVLDTMRADRLGSYGHSRSTSPHLDALARSGVRFDQVIAPASWTLPSFGSLLSAEYPARAFGRSHKLPRSIVEELELAGLRTAAFTEGGFTSREFDLDRGFAVWVEEESAVRLAGPGRDTGRETQGSVDNTFEQAEKWLRENADEPFFVLIHTYEVHTPYDRREFGAFLDPGRIGPTFEMRRRRPIKRGKLVLTDGEIDYVQALYDGGIRVADRRVGNFLAFLEESGLADGTLVAVTADHGEELGDHYRSGVGDHGHSLLDDLVRVPLILRHPQREFPIRDPAVQARLFDVLPTIAELLGVSLPNEADGRSLVPILEGSETSHRLAFSATAKRGPPRISVRQGLVKYIEVTGRRDALGGGLFGEEPPLVVPPPERQLYDLRSDPAEKNNVVGEQPELAEALSREIERVWADLGGAPGVTPPGDADISPRVREQLEALGYVGGD